MQIEKDDLLVPEKSKMLEQSAGWDRFTQGGTDSLNRITGC